MTLENSIHAEIIILAPFALLAFGALLRQTRKALPLPYTLELLVTGIILGLFLRRDQWTGAMQQSIKILGDVDPHLMIHIFLPPLIFESAASLEWHLLTRMKWHIISLAGPGLLLASGLTGAFLYNLLNDSERFNKDLLAAECNDQWSYSTALLLGVVCSATDPVAVVALLNDLGCKATLSTTIEGESLLNDGTALVLFTILLKYIEGDRSDGIGDYLLTFVKMSIGGALFGTSFGVLVVAWLRTIFNDYLAEISITLSATYLCFFVAEYFLHVSGVIAVVCFGVYFGHIGRTSVSPEVEHFLHEFWQCLGYIANTLIFVIAGCVIGYKLPSFPVSDFFQMVEMYFVCTLIRAGVIGLIYVIFKACGADLEFKDQIVATWAGLRGAVGLSLAMIVFGSSKICDPIRDVVMFHTAGIVVFTVCINSTSMRYLVSFLGLDTVPPSKQVIYDQAMDHLMKAGSKQETHLRLDHFFDSTIWEEARKYYFRADEDKRLKAQGGGSDILAEKEMRRRVLMITKRSYWKQFQDGLLSRSSVSYLIHHTDLALDNESCPLEEWDTYKLLIRLGSTVDKESHKLVASAGSSTSEKRKVKILNSLDSIPVILLVLILVFASCILPFTLDPDSSAFFIIENTTTAIFVAELCLRLYCMREWRDPCSIDPFITIDIIAIVLDVLLLSVEDLLGNFSEFTKGIRSIRFLRLFRLLRLARVANRLNKAKIAAMSETTTLLAKSESFTKRYQRRILFSRLKHGFEIASAFKIAREEVLLALKHIQTNGNHLHYICQCIEEDINHVRTSLLDTQRLYNEIAASITTSMAARTVLNKQRCAIISLHKEGLLDIAEFKRLTGLVEYQMKALTHNPPIIGMPKKKDILKQIPWLECVNDEELTRIASSFKDNVFERGEILVKQDEKSDSVHVLARGTVAVSYIKESGEQVIIDELGMGSVFGEIAWALNCIRGATIVATSPGLLFTIPGSLLRDIAESNEQLGNKLWETCGRRLSENLLATKDSSMSRRQIREMVHEFDLHSIDPENKKLNVRYFVHSNLLISLITFLSIHNFNPLRNYAMRNIIYIHGLLKTRFKFYDFGKIILLRGSAIVAVNSIFVEAPDILPAAPSNEMASEVEFSTDAKFMCHRFALEGDTFAAPKTKHKRVSFAELEIKRSKFLPNRENVKDFVRPGLRRSAVSYAKVSSNNRRHLSFTAGRNGNIAVVEKPSEIRGTRRSTIDV